MTAQLSDRGGWRGAVDRGMGWLPARLRRGSAVVPVVRLSGVIGAVTPLRPGMTLAAVAKTLEKAFATKNARAVALVINSPGGSPVQSRQIYLRIRQLAHEKNLQVMVPTSAGALTIGSITQNGAPVTYTTQTIKGVSYAIITVTAGPYSVAYH